MSCSCRSFYHKIIFVKILWIWFTRFWFSHVPRFDTGMRSRGGRRCKSGNSNWRVGAWLLRESSRRFLDPDMFAFRCLNRFYDFMSLRYCDEFLMIGMILWLSCPQIILVLGWACHLWQSPPVKRIEVSQRVCHTKQFKSRLPDPSHEKNLKSLNKKKFLFFHFVSMFVIPLRVQLFKGYRQCRQPLTFCLVYTSHFAPNSYLYIPRCCMFFAVSWKKQYLSLGFPIICWEGYKKLFGAKYPLRRLSTT